MISPGQLRGFAREVKIAGLISSIKSKARGGLVEAGKALGEGLEHHSKGIGREAGAGAAEHVEGAAGRAVEGGYQKVKEWAAQPSVRAAGGTAAGAYAVHKGYQTHKQHKRDQQQERMTRALEQIAKGK